MTDNDQRILDLMISFGFRSHGTEHTGAGSVKRYKYYPNYFHGQHYTLILFKHDSNEYCDHRLYIHKDADGSFIDSPYQTSSSNQWGFDYIMNKINNIFESELRILRIQEIIS